MDRFISNAIQVNYAFRLLSFPSCSTHTAAFEST
jgi:hypothetical protein